MNDKQRLIAWMEENGHDCRSLSLATGDTYSNIHMMTKGDRHPNDAFKWRFQETFGHEVAMQVFGTQETNVPAVAEA